MARKIEQVNKEALEKLVQEALLHIGVKAEPNQCNLFLRLFVGAIAQYFYKFPDTSINLGFVNFKKNPEKSELFAVELDPNEEAGVINAETLYQYYTGDLKSTELLKETMDTFIQGLLSYSQIQSQKISTLTSKIQGRRKKNGI